MRAVNGKGKLSASLSLPPPAASQEDHYSAGEQKHPPAGPAGSPSTEPSAALIKAMLLPRMRGICLCATLVPGKSQEPAAHSSPAPCLLCVCTAPPRPSALYNFTFSWLLEKTLLASCSLLSEALVLTLHRWPLETEKLHATGINVFLNNVPSLLLSCIPSQLPSLSRSASKAPGPVDLRVALAVDMKDGIPPWREEMGGMG